MSYTTQLVYIGGLLQGGNYFFEVGRKSEYVINYIVFIVGVLVYYFPFFKISKFWQNLTKQLANLV
jgi:hypothetical protein